MKQTSSAAVAATFALALAFGPAHAQFFWNPPPPLMGQASFHLYSVPGVISSGGVETYFACTNTTPANIRAGIEIFGSVGGAAISDPSGSSLDVPPGGTVLFSTNGSVWTTVNSILGGGFSKGSARILATKSKGIICSAFLADPGTAPPTFMAKLSVVKKAKQKGE
jgi:hypothetical protein